MTAIAFTLVTTLLAGPSFAGEAPAVELRVDTTQLEAELGDRLGAAIRSELAGGLDAQGVEVSGDAEGVTVVARVELIDEDMRTFALKLYLLEDGAPPVLLGSGECEACSETRVVEAARGLLPPMREHLSEPEPEPETETEPEAETTDLAPPPGRVDRRFDVGPVGFAGMATITGGLASVIGGALLRVMPPPPLVQDEQENDPQKIGSILLGVGASAVALGAAGLVVDLVVLAPRRQTRSLWLSPELSSTSAGLKLSGRF